MRKGAKLVELLKQKDCPASGQDRDQSCTSEAGRGASQKTLELPDEVQASLLVFSFSVL